MMAGIVTQTSERLPATKPTSGTQQDRLQALGIRLQAAMPVRKRFFLFPDCEQIFMSGMTKNYASSIEGIRSLKPKS